MTLSYYEAGRWLDAQETVEQVPAPPEVIDWVRDFVDAHYVIEPKRRRRPESFRPLVDRFGNAASVTTEKSADREPAMSEGFLGRWSRRKQAERAGQVPDEQPPTPPAPPQDTPPATLEASTTPADPAPEPPPLTLADAQALTIESDFRPFVAREVAPEVKNAAFKKLFADPHFNVMDGLDTYVDDYSKPTPCPTACCARWQVRNF